MFSFLVLISGQEVTLNCGKVESDLPFSYNWKLHEDLIDGEFSSTLNIKTTSSSSGVYTCIVTSLVGQTFSQGILLNIYAPPKLQAKPEDVNHLMLNEFVNASFICEVSGIPRPNVSWFYKDFKRREEISLLEFESEIILKNINASHAGFYYCKANNIHGAITSRFARLNVLKVEFPELFIEMSIDILKIEQNLSSLADASDNQTYKSNHDFNNSTVSNLTNTYIKLYDELAERLRTSTNQNISYLQTKNGDLVTLHFTIKSIIHTNVSHEMRSSRDFLEVSTQSRQDLANSAASLVNMIFLNKSKIFVQDFVLFVDNTSLTYKATLDKCQPDYKINKNGIFCGKNHALF